MKKKLGDLTVRELKELQKEKCRINTCRYCPFKGCCVSNRIDLDQEIEVEEFELLKQYFEKNIQK